MTPEDGFLSDICEHPEEDGARLVYADWLDDHRQPERAEFIRVQCELAGLPDHDPRGKELVARGRALLRKHEAAWLGPLRAWLSRWEFRRGLVEEMALKAQTLLKHADVLFRLAPIRHADVHKAVRLGHDLAGCRHLARLASLRVRELYHSDAVHLATSPNLGGLTWLALPGDHLTDEGVEALAGSRLLSQLSRLDLTANYIRDRGVQALAASANVSRLEWLDLGYNRVGPEGATALATSPGLAGLRWLRLDGYWVGQPGVDLLKARFGERVHFR
jgi:uncharacterized protein (TIGR02996 family)